ncbi:MAG TPA: M20/M25/M40 family metallo-hydrolase [Firmicutes bacterium]|nr:M20/M25/M40 family metallo-hydrolase [Bacillota bacterium]
MDYTLKKEIEEFLDSQQENTVEMAVTLAKIPSPSLHEERKAEFVCETLHQMGYEKAYIDSSNSVVCPLKDDQTKKATVFCAHIDTVFPDTEELPIKREAGKIYAPGIGDNSANVAALLTMARMLQVFHLQAKKPILFAFTSGEEGLGNLKGIRSVLSNLEGRIDEVVAVDGGYLQVVNHAVGSNRYRVTVKTEGGHSYGNFGNRNAIACLSQLIGKLYEMKVPSQAKSTYNVGTIQGGTSVNAIAQECSMLFEMRSEKKECLDKMVEYFEQCVHEVREIGVQVDIEMIGQRPCAQLSGKNHLEDKVMSAAKTQEIIPEFYASSTDANLPLSQNIPAICFGTYLGGGAHTRCEFLQPESMRIGMKILASFLCTYFDTGEIAGGENAPLQVEHHAVMIGCINKAIMQVAPNNAEYLIEQCMKQYGLKRGGNMARQALKSGFNLDIHSYNAYRQWDCEPGASVSSIVSEQPDYHVRVTRCPWQEAWQRYGLTEFGNYYCDYIDKALTQGFGGGLELRVGKTLSHGDSFCDFIWLDAGYDAKTQQAVSHRVHGAGIMGWKEMTEDLCTTCTSVLTEHVPQLAPIILRKALLNFSEIYGEELASTFESCLQES